MAIQILKVRDPKDATWHLNLHFTSAEVMWETRLSLLDEGFTVETGDKVEVEHNVAQAVRKAKMLLRGAA